MSYWDVPFSWADVNWLTAPVSIMSVWVDISRITQGIDVESGRRTTGYDRVAGKETLVRAQLYTYGTITPITAASCTVVQASHLSDTGVRTVIPQITTLVPASISPAADAQLGASRLL